MKKVMLLTTALILSLIIGGCSDNNDETGPDPRVAAFRNALENSGFAVSEGSTKQINPFQFIHDGVIDSCAGNNAGQPYKCFPVPLIPGEEDGQGRKEQGVFRLQPYEAIVYVGPTPPEGDYFSYTAFLWVRHHNSLIEKGDWLFAALGDPTNNLTIRTEGGGSPFEKNTMIVFTPDEGIYNRILAAAELAGYTDSMINLYVIPSTNPIPLTYLGLGRKSDSMLVLVRTANFKDQQKGNDYLNNNAYGTVFRVTPESPPALQPYEQPPARNRNWQKETDLIPDLDNGLERLKTAILEQTEHVQFRSFESIRWFFDSREVLPDDPTSPAYHQFVAGEASDTPYLRTAENGSAANFTLGMDDLVIVYGVNHAATGIATYSSLSVYGDWQTNQCDPPSQFIFGCNDHVWNGVAGMNSHSFVLNGKSSAEEYIPGDPVAPYLYAVKVKRTCAPGEKFCVPVPRPGDDPDHKDNPYYGIGLTDPMLIGYRAYLNPATKSGPSYDDIVFDRAIWFKTK